MVRVREPPEKGLDFRWEVTRAWIVRAKVKMLAITVFGVRC